MTLFPHGEPVLSFTTGPVTAYPEALRAQSRPLHYDYDPAFRAFYSALIDKAARALGTSHRPVILQGEPVLGLQAAAASAIGPDDVVLNLVNGAYGAGFGLWAAPYCRELLEIRTGFDDVIDPDAVSALFAERPDITVVSFCHHDTPSGTINPAAAIGRIARAHGALVIVDTVSSFAGMPILPETCEADLFVTGPNKCLGCPPGLTLLGVSPLGWARMHANPRAPRASVLSVLDWEHAADPDTAFPYTPSISELYAMDAALDRYFAEGPETVWARHDRTARATRAGIRAMGLSLWARDDAIASPTATVVRLPDGIDADALLRLLHMRYGVILSAGRGETAGKVVRIGHMGPSAQPILIPSALAALGGALTTLGARVDIGAGVIAAMEVIG